MAEDSERQREFALGLIRTFSKKPHREHGAKRNSGPYKGWHLHDWGHLVQRVFRTLHNEPLSIPNATVAARLVRSVFPNDASWDERVNREGAHERILMLIESGIAPFAPENRDA
jgi:hypothetical protein